MTMTITKHRSAGIEIPATSYKYKPEPLFFAEDEFYIKGKGTIYTGFSMEVLENGQTILVLFKDEKRLCKIVGIESPAIGGDYERGKTKIGEVTGILVE